MLACVSCSFSVVYTFLQNSDSLFLIRDRLEMQKTFFLYFKKSPKS